VGGLIESYHYSPRDAGFVAGVETLGVGLGSFLVSSLGAHWDRHATIRYGTLLAILGALTPWIAYHVVAVLVFRGLAGVGCGMIAAAVIAAIAQMDRPDRQFGLYFVFSYLLNALYFPTSQVVMTTFGFASMCYLVAAIVLTTYVALRWIAAGPISRTDGHGNLPKFPVVLATISLAVSFFFWVADGAVWSFSEQLGLRSGVSPLKIGIVIAIGQLASMGGAGLAALIDTRFGRLIPTAISIGLSMLGALLLLVPSMAAYCAAILLISFAWTLFLTYLNGLTSALDPTGRVAAMSVFSQTAGMAAGPSLGGILVVAYGYGSVSVLGVVAYLISAAVLVVLAVRSPKVFV
jgi:MFS family permease